MRISYWSSDVCSSVLAKCIRELCNGARAEDWLGLKMIIVPDDPGSEVMSETLEAKVQKVFDGDGFLASVWNPLRGEWVERVPFRFAFRSEEHTSVLQSLMRISYAVFCLNKQTKQKNK